MFRKKSGQVVDAIEPAEFNQWRHILEAKAVFFQKINRFIENGSLKVMAFNKRFKRNLTCLMSNIYFYFETKNIRRFLQKIIKGLHFDPDKIFY